MGFMLYEPDRLDIQIFLSLDRIVVIRVIMLHNLRSLAFRPSGTPGIRSPVTVRSTGYYRLQRFEVRNPPRPFTQLFWVQSGNLSFARKGYLHDASAGDVFHYQAEEAHWIQVGDTPSAYYWITFDGAGIGEWLQGGRAATAPHHAGRCPEKAFRELGKTIRLPTIEAETLASELGLRLLIRALNHLSPPPEWALGHEERLCRDLENLMESRYRDPDFGIEAAADTLRCHRTTLFRIYRARRAVPPSAYLQRLRLQKALKLLEDPTRSIHDIALAAGYRDANYFAKVFRRATGESPRNFREKGPVRLQPPGTSG